MVQNNPTRRRAAGKDPPEPQDQGPDIPMLDAASDSIPHGGQDQVGQPDQGQQLNLEASG